MHRNSTTVSTKQERIAALAKQSPQMAFTSLAYLMDLDWLKEAYRRTRKDGAVSVDGVTADEYEQDLIWRATYGVVAVPFGRASLAEVALPPQRPSLSELDRIPPSPPAISAGPHAHGPLTLLTRSESAPATKRDLPEASVALVMRFRR